MHSDDFEATIRGLIRGSGFVDQNDIAPLIDYCRRLETLVHDIVETNDYEWPVAGPNLQSRALTLVGKSRR